jgi:ATP synthase protein I
LSALDDRIAALKKSQEGGPKKEEHYSAAQVGWRMVTELVAGLGIGLGIGYGLDLLLGTIPIFLVLFTMWGLAAGIKTMLRSAKEIQEDTEAAEAAERDERD